MDIGTYLIDFPPDPAKCLGLKAAGTIYKLNPTVDDAAALAAGTMVDITNWVYIEFQPEVDGEVVYNGVATQIRKILGGIKTGQAIHPNTTQIVPSVEHVVCGM